jgi:hypothetical protein
MAIAKRGTSEIHFVRPREASLLHLVSYDICIRRLFHMQIY